jgi:hypothetical protein
MRVFSTTQRQRDKERPVAIVFDEAFGTRKVFSTGSAVHSYTVSHKLAPP